MRSSPWCSRCGSWNRRKHSSDCGSSASVVRQSKASADTHGGQEDTGFTKGSNMNVYYVKDEANCVKEANPFSKRGCENKASKDVCLLLIKTVPRIGPLLYSSSSNAHTGHRSEQRGLTLGFHRDLSARGHHL